VKLEEGQGSNIEEIVALDGVGRLVVVTGEGDASWTEETM